MTQARRRAASPLASWFLVALLAAGGALAFGACGGGAPLFPAGTTGDTTSSTGAGGDGGAAGQGGDGGQGAGPSCAGGCPADEPICVDDTFCEAACPDGRDLCYPEGAAAGGACCATGQQCCEAMVFGYAGSDLCRPDGEACPIGCPE